MARNKKALDSTQLEFIFENKDKMKQVDIARHLKVNKSCINKIIRGPKAKVVVMNGNFDIDKEWEKCYGY